MKNHVNRNFSNLNIQQSQNSKFFLYFSLLPFPFLYFCLYFLPLFFFHFLPYIACRKPYGNNYLYNFDCLLLSIFFHWSRLDLMSPKQDSNSSVKPLQVFLLWGLFVTLSPECSHEKKMRTNGSTLLKNSKAPFKLQCQCQPRSSASYTRPFVTQPLSNAPALSLDSPCLQLHLSYSIA